MADMVFGEVDWNSADSDTSQKSDFVRLAEGENVVRVMGNPVQFYIHWVTTPDGAKSKINSPANNPELVRRLEDSGFKRQARWLVKVLDRTDDEFRLLEVGPQIYNGIKSLYNNSRWGKVTAYDLTLNRGPKGQQPLYSVTPNPKEPLSGDFKVKFVEFNDRINLEKLIAPSTADAVATKMGWSLTETTTGNTTKTATDEDFNFDFEE
jgi:hypothetical protein